MRKVIIILVVSVLLISCSKQTEQTEEGTKTTSDNIVIEEVTYEDDTSSYVITKNKVTKTASVDGTYNLTDDEEYADFLGEEVTNAPFLINFFCSVMNANFYDPESLEELRADGDDTADVSVEDSEFVNLLEGYTVKDFSFTFIDAESKENIAKCSSKKAGNENIKFEVDRDYSNEKALFGSEIGVYEQE